MQPNSIVLHKSRARYIFYWVMTVFLALVFVFGVLAMFLTADLRSKLAISTPALTAALGAIICIMNVKRSHGTLRVDGTTMTEQTWGAPTQRIDLSKVTRLEVGMDQELVGMHYIGGIGTTAKQTVNVINLTASDGATFKLTPDIYPPTERVKLAPVLQRLQQKTSVEKVGALDTAFAVWFSVDTTTKAAAPSSYTAEGIPRAAYKKKIWKMLLIIGVAWGAIFSIFVVSISRQNSFCTALAKNHNTVTAQVIAATMQRSVGRYQHETTTDPNRATQTILKVRYEVNDTSYTETVYGDYSNKSRMGQLYDEAMTGYIDLVYPPNDPAKVRPAMEFEPGAPLALCEGK